LASVDWSVLRFGKEYLGTALVRDDLMPRQPHIHLVPSVLKEGRWEMYIGIGAVVLIVVIVLIVLLL